MTDHNQKKVLLISNSTLYGIPIRIQLIWEKHRKNGYSSSLRRTTRPWRA